MNFIITGFGRSGTTFLSTMMNKSPTWTVLHEPRGTYDERLFKSKQNISPKILNPFKYNHKYGEVHGGLRFWIGQIPNVKYGIIIRNPLDIMLSVSNRKSTKKTIEIIPEINFFWHKFHEILSKYPQCIRVDFNKMTTDLSYLEHIFNTFGIHDINTNSIDLTTKINKNKNIKYLNFEQLPVSIKEEWNSFSWKYLQNK